MKETISDIIDREEAERKIREAGITREKEELEKKEEEDIENQINEEVAKAVKIIGHRLTMKKCHSTMYYFYFEGRKDATYAFSLCKHLSASHRFEYYNYTFVKINGEFTNFLDSYNGAKINLIHLSKLLIDWCQGIAKRDKER